MNKPDPVIIYRDARRAGLSDQAAWVQALWVFRQAQPGLDDFEAARALQKAICRAVEMGPKSFWGR
jgi:hypothetical protein